MKNLKTRRTVLGLNLACGPALLAQPNGYFSLAGPTTQRGCGARSMITASMAIVVARPGWARWRIPDGGSPKRRIDGDGQWQWWAAAF
jgi:hypothetical protein